ncbi:glutamate synthase large subunit [Chitinispirillales bacterium ANBcel5]|uniref:glutamate synthase large subunit n=1 Tax=Cellulosispirillum alkaliphilum TaxID=3039283 RepID=UPI002A4E543B|nr:glutamate synthase large subunit [Chitinispirillales bacterium ANBcel5]
MGFPEKQGLYNPANEHDACGVGFLVNIEGQKTHSIIEKGIEVLKNLMHRGATGADSNTGDGAGLLFQLPERFFRNECDKLGIVLPQNTGFGVGMCFLPKNKALKEKCIKIGEMTAESQGLKVTGWREVPVNPKVLGQQARNESPSIFQCFISSDSMTKFELEQKLYVVRKMWLNNVRNETKAIDDFYIVSLSCMTIIYKGMLQGTQMAEFYTDLQDKLMESSLVVVHKRYSTNTFPSWRLAQPFRCLAHNGEINTIKGNRANMGAREKGLESEVFGDTLQEMLPVIEEEGSDSAALDNAMEFFTHCGRKMHHSAVMMIPQGWGEKYPMGPDLRGFFEYHAGLMEPWDGPATVVFTDGKSVGAILDRNGLRPARYTITHDGFMVLASETGVVDLPPETVKEMGALRPGQIILADTEAKTLRKNCEIKLALARRKPYRRWVEENRIDLYGNNAATPVLPDESSLKKRQMLFGYTREDEKVILNNMAVFEQEPKGSMGSDQPLAVFSEKPHLLYWYFKQMFAQVTNPAIDPIREELVMSLMTTIGNTESVLTEKKENARLIKMRHPILSNDDLKRMSSLQNDDFKSVVLKTEFKAGGNGKVLKRAITNLCDRAVNAVREGYRIVVLSDKGLKEGEVPIPMLLAVSAVHNSLIREGLKTKTGLIAETGEAREVSHFALLLGYGACAINPYLAFETITEMANNKRLEKHVTAPEAVDNYVKAICKGLLKVMSKMGISTLRSYRNACFFEAIGLNREVIEKYFEGTPTRIEGLGIEEIAVEANTRYRESVKESASFLPSGGQYKYRKDGERHMWTPQSIKLLQRATRENDKEIYNQFAEQINEQTRKLCTLRGLFRIKKSNSPIPVEEVEPVSEIVKRFATGAMSFGSLSIEAHQTLAIAMNRLGAMSNSGEGGEDSARYKVLPNGDNSCSAIKQVASGRFGVTIEYLVNAKEIQIKIAQGAKPGEGGHLPGHKVNEQIASVRNSTPGVTLISPPPHHDVYSIEDIAQLIYDLKNANPEARISVKLVSECGVGTVAAGLAKGHADVILISGYDGGTGAAPLSSIKHAGIPWELGLSETQQTLMLNGLRSRVKLQTDGQLRTGRDVLVAALLGAEEFGFATAPLVVCGCVMMRKCHNNTCPVGVATQDKNLRKKFSGKPEYIVNYFTMVAEELRSYMAQLGFRKFDDMIGRSDLLETNDAIEFWKAKGLNLEPLFYRPDSAYDDPRCTRKQNHGLEKALDYSILSKCAEALKDRKKTYLKFDIRNIHRSVGTIVSSEVAKRYGSNGLPESTLTLSFKGTAGQSFAAFGAKGISFILEGEANDYVAKGLSGARVIIRPSPQATYDTTFNTIAGNVILYGATSGQVFINGQAGERFAIRNSGAVAVVEGIGDHGCEYMTGGKVVVLGETGVNFGAGMSGGIAYVLDKTGMFDNKCNLEMIDLELVKNSEDVRELRSLIEQHVAYTGSVYARDILQNWEATLPFFIKVFPMEYRRALSGIKKEKFISKPKEVLA